MRGRAARGRWVTLAAALAVGGCGAPSAPVVRIVDGRPIEGSAVDAEAYGAALRGAMALEAGDADAAAHELAEAQRQDPHDGAVEGALLEARCLRRGAAPVVTVACTPEEDRARCVAVAACALARGDGKGACAAARSAAAKPGAPSPEMEGLLMEACLRAGDDRGLGARALALTLLMPQSQEGWLLLARWAAHAGDPWLRVRALREVLARAPNRAPEAARAVAELAAGGHPLAAQGLAGAVVDAAPRDQWAAPEEARSVVLARDRLVASLAVDDALAHGDVPLARRRAVRCRMTPDDFDRRASTYDGPPRR